MQLAAGTNELDLSVGMQLRREEDGPWLLSGQSTVLCRCARFRLNQRRGLTTGSAAAASGAESEIIKKLMQKREQGINANENDPSLPSHNVPVHRHFNPGCRTGARHSHQ